MAVHRTARSGQHHWMPLLAIILLATSALPEVDSVSSRKSFSSHFAPNFDPEYPQFTPFNAHDFVRMDSEMRVGDGGGGRDSATPHPSAAAPFVASQKLFSSTVLQKRPADEEGTEIDNFDDLPMASIASAVQSADQSAEQQFGADDIAPFQSFVLDLYKNYRQVFSLGNQTIGSMLGVSAGQLEDVVGGDQPEALSHSEETAAEVVEIRPSEAPKPAKVRRTFKPKRNKHQLHSRVQQPKRATAPQVNQIFDADEVRYNVGPGVNISVEPTKELVNVFLDEDCLKDVFTGRGRKHDLISKILPLFILPFLIQSAIVPFAVTTLKLLLVKSILVGKLAIFLLIISALKNHHNKYSSYDPSPQYVVDPPSRRSEAAGVPAGYRVEGKPTTWVN